MPPMFNGTLGAFWLSGGEERIVPFSVRTTNFGGVAGGIGEIFLVKIFSLFCRATTSLKGDAAKN